MVAWVRAGSNSGALVPAWISVCRFSRARAPLWQDAAWLRGFGMAVIREPWIQLGSMPVASRGLCSLVRDAAWLQGFEIFRILLDPRHQVYQEKCINNRQMKTLIQIHKEGKYFVAIDLITNVADQGFTEDEAISNLKKGLEEHYQVLLELVPKGRKLSFLDIEVERFAQAPSSLG